MRTFFGPVVRFEGEVVSQGGEQMQFGIGGEVLPLVRLRAHNIDRLLNLLIDNEIISAITKEEEEGGEERKKKEEGRRRNEKSEGNETKNHNK